MKTTINTIKQDTNEFINLIYNKPTTGFFKKLAYKKKIKKFRKDILEGSPSFGLLWKMADFIKFAENVFFFDNHPKNKGLFSSRSYTDGQNGFKISPENEAVEIIVKLYSDTKRVVVEIERGSTSNGFKNNLTFEDDSWITVPTIDDEMLLENVIRRINTSIVELFDKYYAQR